jgi:hypothetical protein
LLSHAFDAASTNDTDVTMLSPKAANELLTFVDTQVTPSFQNQSWHRETLEPNGFAGVLQLLPAAIDALSAAKNDTDGDADVVLRCIDAASGAMVNDSVAGEEGIVLSVL